MPTQRVGCSGLLAIALRILASQLTEIDQSLRLPTAASFAIVPIAYPARMRHALFFAWLPELSQFRFLLNVPPSGRLRFATFP